MQSCVTSYTKFLSSNLLISRKIVADSRNRNNVGVLRTSEVTCVTNPLLDHVMNDESPTEWSIVKMTSTRIIDAVKDPVLLESELKTLHRQSGSVDILQI